MSNLAPKVFKFDNNKVVSRVSDKANEKFVNLPQNNKSRNSTYVQNIKTTKKSNFLTRNAKKPLNYL